jgi:hypothetical protein
VMYPHLLPLRVIATLHFKPGNCIKDNAGCVCPQAAYWPKEDMPGTLCQG